MAGLFDICKPRIFLYKGLFQLLSEHRHKARTTWNAALNQARRLNMCYDEALILTEMGRHCPIGSKKRQENLTAASDIFARIKAQWRLEHCDKLLAKER